jgi:serine/threonine protein kinase
MSLTAETQLGPYKIIALIGAGGMGEVYRARDTRLLRDVALKVLPESFTADPDRLRRFEQEARAVAALNHPNIVSVYDVGNAGGVHYIVSELLEGETLRQLISPSGMAVRKTTELGIQLAQGLAAAHEQGIVHRDLKPENIFVTRNGRLKILDFGLAKLRRPQTIAETWMASPWEKRTPARFWGPLATCRRNRCGATPRTIARTFSVSAAFCTKCSMASVRSSTTPAPRP